MEVDGISITTGVGSVRQIFSFLDDYQPNSSEGKPIFDDPHRSLAINIFDDRIYDPWMSCTFFISYNPNLRF